MHSVIYRQHSKNTALMLQVPKVLEPGQKAAASEDREGIWSKSETKKSNWVQRETRERLQDWALSCTRTLQSENLTEQPICHMQDMLLEGR